MSEREATIRISIPGIGGSLGECVVCGKPFLAECLGIGLVQMMGMNGGPNNMPVHQDCYAKVKDIHNWEDLPEGPLRNAISEIGEA
jgi:hypothetical protein